MNTPQTKTDILEQLAHIRDGIKEVIQNTPADQFDHGTDASWSAAGYLKHLILSVKPVAKAINFPLEQLKSMFGQSETTPKTYDEIVALYKSRLAEGVRAEDYDRVVPNFYRFPEGVTNTQTYLAETWDESNQRLLTALENWSESDLDTYQLPHPAIGMITVRETLYFTLYHNALHWVDMQQAVLNAQTG